MGSLWHMSSFLHAPAENGVYDQEYTDLWVIMLHTDVMLDTDSLNQLP